MSNSRAERRRIEKADSDCQCLAPNHEAQHPDGTKCGNEAAAQVWTPFGEFRLCGWCEHALMGRMVRVPQEGAS